MQYHLRYFVHSGDQGKQQFSVSLQIVLGDETLSGLSQQTAENEASPCKSRWNMKHIPEWSKRMIACKIYILPLAAQIFYLEVK